MIEKNSRNEGEMMRKEYGEPVDFVYSECDYSKFKKLNGNREVLEGRKKMIKSSIEKRGWIRNPIVVNEKFELIDGQGRFEALKELGLPIEYVVSEGATIDDCIALNMKQLNWKPMDFISCYADLGYPDYQFLRSICEEYKAYCGAEIVAILLGVPSTTGKTIGKGGDVTEGRFKVYDKASARNIMDFFVRTSEACKGKGAQRKIVAITKFAWYCPEISNRRWLEKIEKYGNTDVLEEFVREEETLRKFERVYNYKQEKKVFFSPLWERFKGKEWDKVYMSNIA